MFLLVISAGFAVARFGYDVPIPIERAIAFPIAVVPNVWELWNMLYVRQHSRRWVSLGTHGAMLPVLFVPLGITFAATVLPAIDVPALLIAALFAGAVAAYYLVWKFVVGFLKEVLGIA